MQNRKGVSNTIQPLFDIPDIWAKQSQCPLCDHAPMQVVHSPNAPDQMLCSQCKLSFEVERGGSRVRLVDLPSRLRAMESYLSTEWMSMKDVSGLIDKKAAAALPLTAAAPAVTAPTDVQVVEAAPTAEAATPSETLSNEELLDRAQKLIALGNTPQKVRTIFEGAKFSTEQIDFVMAEIVTRDRQKREGANRTMWLVSSVGGLSLLILIGLGAFILTSPQFTKPTPTAAATRALVLDPEKFLAPFAQFLPGIKPGVAPSGSTSGGNPIPQNLLPNSGAPTPGAQQGVGPVASKCPTSPAAASSLFGGLTQDWKTGEFPNTWVFASATSSTIRVPAKMSAGYLRGGASLEMISVNGPATLTNVNFVAMSCE